MKKAADADRSSPAEYIDALREPRRSEIQALHDAIRKALPDLEPSVQSGMIGYGKYHYRYATGREGDCAVVGLSSRANYISVYVQGVEDGQYVAEKYKADLPKADIGKSCIRFKRLADIDLKALERIIKRGAKHLASAAAK
jgi:hypothetical protein